MTLIPTAGPVVRPGRPLETRGHTRRRRISENRLELAYRASQRWIERTPQRSGAMEAYKRSGPLAADTPARAQQFTARESLRPLRQLLQERQIGPTLDYTSYAPDEESRRAGRPVARIVDLPQLGNLPEGFGTGFLVGPDLLLTNHHVLPSKAESAGIGANFLHEYNAAGLNPGVIFELDPEAFYYSNEELDFALVAVKTQAVSGGQTLDAFQRLPLIETTGKILVGHPVNIIQHPAGGPKQYATTQNKLLDVLDQGFLHYSTDTLAGSSGSPAFNQHWEVIGLHHLGVPLIQNGRIIAKNGQPWDRENQEEDDILWVANEGVRVSAIVRHLRSVVFPDPARAARLATVFNVADAIPAAESTAVASSVKGAPDMTNVTISISGPVTMYVNPTITEPKPVPVMPPAVTPVVDVTPIARPQIEEKKLRFDKRYKNRPGYKADFLGVKIPMPTVSDDRDGEILKDPKDPSKTLILKYHHFSLAMNEHRRLQMWSAVNVDYSPSMKSDKPRAAFGSDTWIPDPRILGEQQIQDEEFYKPATKVDRGHIVRREDNCWGDDELEIEFSNSDTFHWTNCTPQHERFNQDGKSGLWGQFEVHITEQIQANGNRCSIFAGPLLDNENDPSHDFGEGPVQYPLRFWKVIAAVNEEDALQAWGFLFDQSVPIDRFGLEALDFARFERFQVSLDEITRLTGVQFPPVLRNADVLAGFDERVPVRDLADVRLKKPETAEPAMPAEEPARSERRRSPRARA